MCEGAVQRANAPRKLRKNAPDAIPVSVIGRMAVSSSQAGKGLGAIAIASQRIGIGAAMVHAKDENARAFDLSCAEFIEFPADSKVLFLQVEMVVGVMG